MAIYMVEKALGNVTLIDVRGRLTLGPETEALRTMVRQLLEAGRLQLLLDLGEVTYIDSVGLSTLVASYTSARKQGGDVKLVHLPRGVSQLLQITRLSTVFEIFDDLTTAEKSFAAKAG
jgi:anti-sigma B factor antagonist